MTNEEKNFFNQWSGTMESAYQNMGGTYANLVTPETLESSYKEFTVMQPTAFGTKSTGNEKHDFQAHDVEKRRITAAPAYVAHKYDRDEMARQNVHTMAAAAQEDLMAKARWEDAVVRDALTGNATAQYAGESSFSTKTLSGAGQEIATGGAQITEAKIRETNSLFRRQYVLKNGEDVNFAISQEEADTLMGLTVFQNKDTNDGSSPVSTGVPANAYGVKFVLDQDLNYSSSVRTNIAWVKSAIKFAMQQSPLIRAGELEEQHFNFQRYMAIDVGAQRQRELGVLAILNTQSY